MSYSWAYALSITAFALPRTFIWWVKNQGRLHVTYPNGQFGQFCLLYSAPGPLHGLPAPEGRLEILMRFLQLMSILTRCLYLLEPQSWTSQMRQQHKRSWLKSASLYRILCSSESGNGERECELWQRFYLSNRNLAKNDSIHDDSGCLHLQRDDIQNYSSV